MAKKSAALVAMPGLPPRAESPRITPPTSLTADQIAVWRATVRALPAAWFTPEMAPLIELFAVHVCRGRDLNAAIQACDLTADLPRFEKLAHLAAGESGKVAGLARAMRLTPQSRLKAETAANRAGANPQRTPDDDRAAIAEFYRLNPPKAKNG